jgi:hypothetical protein
VKFTLTRHAREQMDEQEDNVTEEQIDTVLENWHTTVPGNQPSAIRYVGFVGVSKELSVVTAFPGVGVEPVKVVTVYWEE